MNKNQIWSETSLLWDHKQQRRLVTDVSGQPVLPILKGQVVQVDGLLDHCIETSLNTNICSVIPQKSERSHSHRGASLKSHRLNSVSLKKKVQVQYKYSPFHSNFSTCFQICICVIKPYWNTEIMITGCQIRSKAIPLQA